jgi:Family of unknown function (DUF6492)
MIFPLLAPDAAVAIITPSYAGDLDRCRLLCETLDHVGGSTWTHLLLVADGDMALFKGFEGPRRSVIPDSAYLPRWLRPVRNPLDGRRRWLSLSPRRPVWPMSGWHVQQLRKLCAATLTDAPILLMADSDTVFVRPIASHQLIQDGKARLYVKRGNITATIAIQKKHPSWLASTGDLLGIPPQALPADDYINNLVTWRRDVALQLIEHVQTSSGRELASALGRYRTFSEYLLYGQFADRVLGDASGHWHSDLSLGHTYWSGRALDEQGLDSFVSEMALGQIAFGIQSFTATSVDLIRRWLGTRRVAGSEAI